MAYAPIPNLVTIHAPKIGCNQLSMNTLTEVLQSESVKRLLNRQNVYLQTPLTDGSVASDLASSRNSLHERRNGSLGNDRTEKIPELSVIPIMNYSEREETELASTDDKHLLPSKNDGKSAIALLPLGRERRSCGHREPCESIVCNVEFQQLIDSDNILPLVATNIETGEIDATVTRHCENEKCDALSIDHDRCRRAVVRCHRCDRTSTCDICLALLKTRKSRMMHKSCKIRVEYRHNKTSRGQLMRDRMRVRELQILDAAKTNKNDYTDPMTGHDRAIESLQKNSELIVIPKTAPSIQQRSAIRITAVSGGTLTPNVYTSDTLGKFMPRYPLVLPARRMLVKKATSVDSTDYVSLRKSTTKDDLTFSAISPRANQFISINRAGNFTHPVNFNDYLQTQSQTSSTSQLQSASYLMPIRVVPIAGLKTEPSLLHQTHGVPKFCLVSQTPNQSATFAKTPTMILPAQQQQQQQHQQLQQLQPKPIDRVCVKSEESNISRKTESSGGEFVLKRFKPGVRRGRRKKNGAKRGSKSFECTFCFKRFSTDWYFKLHIAKHKGEIKFTCKFCKKPFMHHYNMTKHIVTMHKQEIADDDSFVKVENGEFLHCSICKIIFETKTEMESHRCPVVCLRCHTRIVDGDLTRHLRTKHAMSEEQVNEEFERQKRQMAQNRGRKNRETLKEQARGGRNKDETRERENGAPKRKRTSLISNDARGQRDVLSNDQISMKTPVRRLRRRRNHSLVEQLVNASMNKNLSVTREDVSTPELSLSSITADTELISR